MTVPINAVFISILFYLTIFYFKETYWAGYYTIEYPLQLSIICMCTYLIYIMINLYHCDIFPVILNHVIFFYTEYNYCMTHELN